MNQNEDEYLFKVRLYENIIKLIIVKHEESKPKNQKKFTENQKKNNEIFQSIFENLSELAVGIVQEKSYEAMRSDQHWKTIDG